MDTKSPGDPHRRSVVDRVVCAWCGKVMRGDPQGEGTSHGVCAECLANTGLVPVDSVHHLDREAVERLPFGLLHLDREGYVRRYNMREARLSGRDPAEVIGRHFFNEVAPCAKVREFEGRFLELRDAPHPAREDFRFVFRFADGAKLVHIALNYHPEHGTVILVEPQVS